MHRNPEELAAQCGLLRDLAGASSSPAVDPAWEAWDDFAVAKLAQAAYEERHLPGGHLDPARLGVLADALEGASCDNADLLAHLRSAGLHVRGCWAVDLVTGRS